MVEQADKALYYSKENGRNQVTNYDGSMGIALPSSPALATTPALASPAATPKPAIAPSVPVLAIRTPESKPSEPGKDMFKAGSLIKENTTSTPVLSVRENSLTEKSGPGEALDSSDYGTLRLDRHLLPDTVTPKFA